MIEYGVVFEINDEDKYNDFRFEIQLRNEVIFKLNDCYCIFNKKKDKDLGEEIHQMKIVYYSHTNNKNDAITKIRNCIHILSYIFAVPMFDKLYIHECNVKKINYIPNKKNADKIKKVTYIDSVVNKLKKTKEDLYYIMNMYCKATQYLYMEDLYEEAYLSFFKIIENISKRYFNIQKKCNKIRINKNILEKKLKNILKKDLNLVYSNNKIENITGIIENELINIVESDVYSKISYFCNEYNIKSIDYDILGKSIKLRNSIAHGSNENINEKDEELYFIVKLCREMIAKKFFNSNYNNVSIKSKYYWDGKIVDGGILMLD